MELLDIGPDTADLFFSCLTPRRPEGLPSALQRRAWCADYRDRGYKAQVLVLDDGTITAKCHTIPIEHSPFVGRNLGLAIEVLAA